MLLTRLGSDAVLVTHPAPSQDYACGDDGQPNDVLTNRWGLLVAKTTAYF